jgi:hypothetical protein
MDQPDSSVGDTDDKGRVSQTQESFSKLLSSVDAGVRNKLTAAVTVAGERSGDLLPQLESIGQRTAEVARPVLNSVKDHIEDNDIDVTITGNKIHIEGDEEGLKNVEADLKEALKNTSVHAEYDRDDGINLEVGDQS